MDWWKKIICPIKTLCFHVSARFKDHHRQTGGLLKLRDDIQTCGYEDVQVMWEMLRKNETEVTADRKGIKKLKQWPSWKFIKVDTKSAVT
ncbi:unnamed protein product [Rhodiola kirilowii]